MSALKVFLTTWNTGLQGSKAQSQDLTSWLLPVLQSSSNEPEMPKGEIPDIYAIGIQELLPLHLALAGLTSTVISALTHRIESLLSSHAKSLSPEKTPERYFLMSKESHCGVALWLFGRESTMRSRIGKPLGARLGLWYGGMGNKGAVGIRLPVERAGKGNGGWEVLTFVCAHLDAHDHNIARRNAQYQMILSHLLFYSSDPLSSPTQVHDSSHLFVMGDLNYRFSAMPSSGYPTASNSSTDQVTIEKERAEMVHLDTLRKQQAEGKGFGGLREGDLTKFAPTYKCIAGQVHGYSRKRIPGYTDRILFASHTDSEPSFTSQLSNSSTQINHFGSTPETTLSDHKPVHLILTLPPSSHTSRAPHLAPTLGPVPEGHRSRPIAVGKEELLAYRVIGTTLDKLIGWPWTILVLLGLGDMRAGMGVSAFVAMIWGVWWSGAWSGGSNSHTYQSPYGRDASFTYRNQVSPWPSKAVLRALDVDNLLPLQLLEPKSLSRPEPSY